MRLDEVKIHCVLRAVHDFRPEQPIAHPAEARNVYIGFLGKRNPFDLAAIRTHDS